LPYASSLPHKKQRLQDKWACSNSSSFQAKHAVPKGPCPLENNKTTAAGSFKVRDFSYDLKNFLFWLFNEWRLTHSFGLFTYHFKLSDVKIFIPILCKKTTKPAWV
jgi:hypothetical protein